ncbi:MAG TPA: Type 1 glutamine amidotransferase-like domain-containing protein [Candidatus Dojkabacteria bacterium]|jgi:dipeptidase E
MTLYLSSSVNNVGHKILEDIGNVKRKKLAFITTASEIEEDKGYVASDRESFEGSGVEIFDYTITGKNLAQIDNDLKDMDIIHMEGGDTYYLLEKSRESGFDKWIYEAVRNGKIYTGSSAGSVIASKDISPIYKKDLEGDQGFGLTDILVLPHWGSKSFREKYFSERIEKMYEIDSKIILLNDFQFVKVDDDSFRIFDVRE